MPTHPTRCVSPLTSLLTASVFGTAGLLTAGCSSTPTEDVASSTAEAMTGATAVSRAMEWVDDELQYCQSPYGDVDPDDSCWSQPWESDHRCYRNKNASWDAYRSDCSALVSWAWGLPAPGRVTGEFAPFETDVTHSIEASSLSPGDAVNNSDHVMLFKEWVVAGREATFIEEPGCSTSIKHAHTFTSDVSISGTSIYVPYVGMTFTAIRHDGTTSGGGGGGCVVGGFYCGGDKVKGSTDTLYKCTGGSAGTVEKVCADGCRVNSGTDDSCESGGGSTGGGDCVAGGLYCGGDKVSGDANKLYRCKSGSSGTEVATCSDGCDVRSGQDDVCRGAGGCVPGGLYCGGDKVTGYPTTLYRCTSGSSGAVDEACSNGCDVRPGENDACK